MWKCWNCIIKMLKTLKDCISNVDIFLKYNILIFNLILLYKLSVSSWFKWRRIYSLNEKWDWNFKSKRDPSIRPCTTATYMATRVQLHPKSSMCTLRCSSARLISYVLWSSHQSQTSWIIFFTSLKHRKVGKKLTIFQRIYRIGDLAHECTPLGPTQPRVTAVHR